MSNSSSNNGIGLGTLLAIIFMVLKLTHTIDWSWWWVFAPIWAPIALIFILAVPVGMVRGWRERRLRNSFAEAVRRAPRDRRPQDG